MDNSSVTLKNQELSQIIKLLIKIKVLHEEDCKLSRKHEYVGQKLQKTNQDGFTVKNDDMIRSQSKDKKKIGKIKFVQSLALGKISAKPPPHEIL
ncbi:hypothetical protein Tco_1081327 [Tanacetum coccineum]|uniref:Uncharacterized protein n=1 Tax=Tanacetum coccineum TaxID=301880 RepID=A0ABQ5HZC4_9ASTR